MSLCSAAAAGDVLVDPLAMDGQDPQVTRIRSWRAYPLAVASGRKYARGEER
jgi:hypothetical protein